jgi:hypothetical protein
MKNKDIFCLALIIIILMIIGGTILKVNKNHENNLMLVSEKKITEAAEKCYKEGKCTDNSKITLQSLYANGYLAKEANPVTKEVYNSESYVTFTNNVYTFIQIN